MTIKEQLIKAKELINTPEKWCQYSYSNNGQCCMSGALLKVGCRNTYHDSTYHLLQQVIGIDGKMSLAEWNDQSDREHSQVMEAFDKAIALAEEA